MTVPPGEYVIEPANLTGALYPRAATIPVTVTPGHYTTVTVTFDSGIR